MKLGTKSVLFGAHQFLIHPWFVAFSWWKLYGFPFDPRLWFSFFLHDIGYIGKPNMDGDEGDKHPEFAAKIMGFLFGRKWGEFCLYHSRFYSKLDGKQYSNFVLLINLPLSMNHGGFIYLVFYYQVKFMNTWLLPAERIIRNTKASRTISMSA